MRIAKKPLRPRFQRLMIFCSETFVSVNVGGEVTVGRKDWAFPMRAIDFDLDWMRRLICLMTGGHRPVDDQCGIPSHRFCYVCNCGTPDEEVVR